jgi:hypothetical protein
VFLKWDTESKQNHILGRKEKKRNLFIYLCLSFCHLSIYLIYMSLCPYIHYTYIHIHIWMTASYLISPLQHHRIVMVHISTICFPFFLQFKFYLKWTRGKLIYFTFHHNFLYFLKQILFIVFFCAMWYFFL